MTNTQSWFSAGELADPMLAFAKMGQQALQGFLGACVGTNGGNSALEEFAQLLQGGNAMQAAAAWAPLLAGLYDRLLSGGQSPALAEGLERTHGGVADALGWGPSRAVQDASRELARAALEKQRALAEMAAFLNAAWPAIAERANARLEARGAASQPVTTMLELTRLWTAAAEAVMQERLQSERGLALIAATTRAATAHRLQWNRLVELWSEACNVPTRAELDEAYRDIQGLKRELRELKRRRGGSAVDRPAAAQ